MFLSCHGGRCCGIRHVYGFPSTPDGFVQEIWATKIPKFHGDSGDGEDGEGEDQDPRSVFAYFSYRNPGTPCYPFDAPRETGLDRLKRYISFLDEYQPEGIIEVVLIGYQNKAAGKGIWGNYFLWEKELLDLGFNIVNKCRNSNSSSTLHVFHRNGQG